MPSIKFYENFKIFYDRVKFYAILCRVRPMQITRIEGVSCAGFWATPANYILAT